jgi:KUP system potassium uptake protein
VPMVNAVLLVAVSLAVIGFGSSSRLASAYGVAVMGTMLTTTFLLFFVIRHRWNYPLWVCAPVIGLLLIVDGTFFAAALHKVLDGGWFPLLLGAAAFSVMATWRRGRTTLLAILQASSIPLKPFLDSLFIEPPRRVPGTAVFLTSTPDATPHALLHSLKHYKALHERNVFLTVEFRDVPWVAAEDHVDCMNLGRDCWQVMVRYGFMDRPNVAEALQMCGAAGLQLEPMEVSYFMSREKIMPASGGKTVLARWRDRLFAAMARNAGSVTDFFQIPTNQVVELGTRVEI